MKNEKYFLLLVHLSLLVCLATVYKKVIGHIMVPTQVPKIVNYSMLKES